MAVTIWPAWATALPGLVLSGLAFCRSTRLPSSVLLAAWLVFIVVFAEEPRCLLRSLRPQTRLEGGERLRVVTLNCAGDSQAAAEVAAFRPGLVLLQESPSQQQVQTLARQLYGPGGGVVWGLDTSVMGEGELSPSTPPPERGEFQFVQVGWRLPAGPEVAVISLRLGPSVVRTDLWRPSCWREYRVDRQQRREWLREIAARLRELPAGIPCVVGGDFNAAAGDAIFRDLQPDLHDAFAEAGRGWGNTLLNDLPVVRIDQIWVSRHFRAVNVRAYRTRYSDHRAVVCDLVWR